MKNRDLSKGSDTKIEIQIGLKKVCSVVFDNSALTDLLSSEVDLAKIEERLKTRQLRLLIPFDAITEASSGSNIDAMHGRLVKLGELVERYPDQTILTRDAGVWLRHEWLNGGVLRDIPHLRNSPRFPGTLRMLKEKEEFVRIHGAVGEFRLESHERKAELKTRDIKFRNMAVTNLPKDEPLEILKKLKDRVPFSGLSSFEISFSFLPRFSRTKLRRAFYSRAKYKILRCYCSLFYIRALANAVDTATCPPEFHKLLKIVEGNWYDLGLIAAAASQDFLITNDKGQAAVTEFARDRNFIRCSAITLAEFLSLS